MRGATNASLTVGQVVPTSMMVDSHSNAMLPAANLHKLCRIYVYVPGAHSNNWRFWCPHPPGIIGPLELARSATREKMKNEFTVQ